MNYIDAIKKRCEADAGPIGIRLQNSFMAAIESGQIPAGKALPPERKLAELLNVSRSTLRDCLQELAARNLVRRKHGSGTEVIAPIRKALSKLSGFTEDMRARGLQSQTKVLERLIGPASSEVSFRTGLPLGTPMMHLMRLRFSDGEVFSLERISTPLESVDPEYDGSSSFYERLDLRGLRPVRILQNLRAVEADADVAAKLEIRTGAALLEIRQVGYASTGQAVEDAIGWYRADRYQYVGEITG
ncbi:MAG: GntR family transcriptional regulator [Aestuariivirga sp.]